MSRVPKDIIALLKEHTIYLAGGFIRATIAGERVNDIDLFGCDKDKLMALGKDLALSRKGRFHETDNAYTILSPPRKPVQFIHRWLFNWGKDLVSSFDFTIAQAAIWWEPSYHDEKGAWTSTASERFYPDLAARRLYYTAPTREEAPGGSILRMRKFLKAGYSIQASSMAALIARVMEGVDEEKLKGFMTDGKTHEEAVAGVVMGLLREVDPLLVVDGFDLIDEHQGA